MSTLYLTHPACLDHVTPEGHPERADRLRAVNQVLSEERFAPLVRGEAPEGNLDLVTLCHQEHYATELRHIAPASGLIYIDGDTSMSPGTWEAVMRGVGGAVAATDAVMPAMPPPLSAVRGTILPPPYCSPTAKLTVANVRKEPVLLFTVDVQGELTFVKKLPPGCKAVLTSRGRIGSG